MKKHLSLLVRIVVALAGLGYVIWGVGWIDKIEVPPGTYALSNNTPCVLAKTTSCKVISGDFNPLKPAGTIQVQVDPANGQPGGTLAIDARQLDPGRVHPGLPTTLRHARLNFVLLGLLVIIPIYFITGGRWWMLLKARGLEVSGWQAFRLTMVGCFFNFFMPGSTGGDVVKAYYAAKNSDRRADSVMTVIIDRIVGLLGLVILAGLAGLFLLVFPEAAHGAVDRHLIVILTAVAWGLMGIICGGAAFYFSRHLRRVSGLDWLLQKLLPRDSVLGKVDAAAAAYSGHKGVVALSILFSLPVHILLAISTTLAGKAVGMTTPVGYLFTVIPITFLIMALPISIQGIGTAEGVAFLLLLHAPYANEPQIVAMLWLARLYQLFYSLGGVVFLFGGDIHLHPPTYAPVAAEAKTAESPAR
jgi:hypothetical protein